MFENLSFTQFLLLYLVLQVVYVILNTVTNIAKIKCSKLIASLTSAVCYGFYVIVVVATASNQPIWVKMLLTAITNVVGVYVGMWVMEKLRKDKLWKIEITIRDAIEAYQFENTLREKDISFNSVICENNDIILNVYSKSQKESEIIKKALAEATTAKYIIHQSDLRF